VCIDYLQADLTPFECAVEEERSKVVKYFIEEAKVDATFLNQVIIKLVSYG